MLTLIWILLARLYGRSIFLGDNRYEQLQGGVSNAYYSRPIVYRIPF